MNNLELLAVGRVGVDLYPQETGPLKDVTSFNKYLGGTATNVAVAATRLGHRASLFTKVGSDGFGTYVREALERFGVDTSHIGTSAEHLTPLAFCELNPPEDPPLLFYRRPTAPDLTLRRDEVPWDAVATVPVFWVTGTGVSVEPARSTQLAMLEHRGRPTAGSRRWTCLDLDWREHFWPSPEEARTEYTAMLDWVNVVVGNRTEVSVAVGTADPHLAADRLLERGVELAMVKMGADGVLVATPDDRTVIAPRPVEVVCGLGAGDAFGGALVHGLLSGWPPARIADYANAAGALVASRLACADAMPTTAELDSFLTER